MKRIILNKGKFALVDDEDFERANKRKWYVSTVGYVVANNKKEKPTTILLHNFLMKSPDGMEIDHINKNKLDNRKSNFRFLPHDLNTQNVHVRKNNSTGFTGVQIEKRTGKFVADIRINGKRKHLGTFPTPEAASSAYQFSLKEYWRERGVTL